MSLGLSMLFSFSLESLSSALQGVTLDLNPFPHCLWSTPVSEAVSSSENSACEVTGILELLLIAELHGISPLLYTPSLRRRP